jgi:creatinine amidohydrolase
MDLTTACWPDLVGTTDVLLVPLGSCEQHGPHLPFVTDAAVAERVARLAASSLGGSEVGVVVAPALAFGASGEHQQFPGTLSIGHEALHHLLVELVRSASAWVNRVVLVNGHGGNLPTVATAVHALRAEGHEVAWIPCAPEGADAHAGRTETSLMRAIAPGSVRVERAVPGATAPLAELMPSLREHGVAGVSPNGVLGDPSGASAMEGHAMLEDLVTHTVDCIANGQVDRSGRLRPASRQRA